LTAFKIGDRVQFIRAAECLACDGTPRQIAEGVVAEVLTAELEPTIYVVRVRDAAYGIGAMVRTLGSNLRKA
jgi:hypothetical protein